MALLLSLESSTAVCSVSLSRDGELIDFLESHEGMNHARLLSLYVATILEKNQIGFELIDAVVVSEGPGSYTGLRIGVSLAKGLCYSRQLPLIAVNPLKAMSMHVAQSGSYRSQEGEKPWLYIPMTDARRMEVYTAVYDVDGNEREPVQAKIIDKNSFLQWKADYQLVFFGNGAEKCASVLQGNGVCWQKGIETSARFMCRLAEDAYQKGDFEDIAYFEPFYLKDFVAGISQKNVLKPR